jgi:predicted MPP superfamily phosphohydrolase
MAVTRRTALKALAVSAAGAAVGTGVYAYAYERHRLQVTRAVLPVSGLPRRLSGLRVGLLTDIHHGPFVSEEDIARAVAMLSKERPDLIVLGGDYVNWQDRTYVGPCAEILGTLKAPNGVFAVLGNHDNERATQAAFERQGVVVLADEHTSCVIKGETIEIAGLRYWTRRVAEIIAVIGEGAGPLLLLAHDPRRLIEAAKLAVPAVLSGHTHGGQVVLPVIGAVAARKFPVVAGVGHREHTSIFVSRGVGTIFLPFRLNCPPEVAVVTLRTRGDL